MSWFISGIVIGIVLFVGTFIWLAILFIAAEAEEAKAREREGLEGEEI